ncbi:hypothetical protein Tco_1504678 [Tanacetum coccineum]
MFYKYSTSRNDSEKVASDDLRDALSVIFGLSELKIQRESTFQVVLDALALTPCYSEFLIAADVLEVYMHQFWDYVYKHYTFYIFKMDKMKRFKLNLEIFKDIFKICPRVQGQDFDALPTDEEIVSFLRDLGHIGEINSLNDIVVDQMHQPWRPFAALINRSLSGKTTGLDKLRLFKAQILWGMYHQKNVDYVELLWEDFIYQIDNKAYKKQEKISKEEYEGFSQDSSKWFWYCYQNCSSAAKIKPSVTNEGTGVKPGVPDVMEDESSESEAKSWGNDEDDSNNDHDSRSEGSDQERDSGDDKAQSDSEKKSDSEHETDENESGFDSDQDKNEDDIEDDEDEVKDKLVKTSSNNSDDEDETKITDKAEVDTDKGFVQEEGTDAEMTNVQQGNENPEISQVIEQHMARSGTDLKMAKLYSPYECRIISPMDVHVHHEVPSKQTPTLLTVHVSVITDTSPVYSTVILQLLPSFNPPPQQSTSTPPPTTEATNPQSTLPDFASVFQFNNKVSALEKDVSELKKDDPLKTQVTALILPKEVSNFAPPEIQGMVTESLEEAVLAKDYSDMPQDQEVNLGNDDDEPMKETVSKRPAFRLLKGTNTNYAELEYNFEECYNALSEKLDWENSEGGDYPFDLTKPLPLVMSGNHQKVPVDYFFNNDLKYLYLKEIVVRIADNDLYRFKEGDFPRLRINDIEDMW